MNDGRTVTVTSRGGIGFVGALTLLFIALKLTGVIAWSWLWVLAPIWISFGLWLIFIIIWLIFVAVIIAADKPKKGHRVHGRY